MDVYNRVFVFICYIILTSVCFYEVTCVQSNGLLSFINEFAANEIYEIENNFKMANNELYKTHYRLVKRSDDDKGMIKKHHKKPILKGPSLTDSIYPKKVVDHLQKVSFNSSIIANSTESSNISIPALKYDTNSSSSPTMMLTYSSSTTPASTTTKPFTTTSISEVLPKKQANISFPTVDHHIYYNSTFFFDKKAMYFWVNFEMLPKENVIKHYMLSDSHRRAATVTLSFDFPFYGHPLRNITIATGGFLYMGDYMHNWLAATQYVAPLMANFDTSLSSDSTVQYFDNGTAFVIEWNEVVLRDEKQGGNFTFQATLLNNGNIIFVYRTIPVSVTSIGDDSHPVKVGLSDAYVVDRVIYFIRRKTIYEYHRIDMKKEEIGNHTAIYFTALTTCLNFRNCSSCMSADIGLNCIWCESANRCSDGLDRQRQDWLQQRCDVEKTAVKCNSLPSTDLKPIVQPYTEIPSKTYTIQSASESHNNHLMPAGSPYPFKQNIHEDDEVISQKMKVGDEQNPVGVGGVVAILLMLGILLGVVAWIGYAYRNPHTSSGQLLIRYRPSQWRLRSGEARYTAASVHM